MPRSRAHLIVMDWCEHDEKQRLNLCHSPAAEYRRDKEQKKTFNYRSSIEVKITRTSIANQYCARVQGTKVGREAVTVVAHFHNTYNHLATERKMNGTRDTIYVTQMNLLFLMWFANMAGVWHRACEFGGDANTSEF